ncbi:COP9 signalosome complex subunit 3 [Trichoplax sp. H2]|nr:COP9 signalosome complex subunit 3 [Trichoplax sp. H2]|eukprot:RDD41433.1 COP9 signalosome complex subunit 3 [Trichoplax sp. H2]
MATNNLSNISSDIRELSESGNFGALKEKLQIAKPTLTEDHFNLDALLADLDVSRHSYGYFYLLHIKLMKNTASMNWDSLFVQGKNFLTHCCKEQLPYCDILLVTQFIGRMVDKLIERGQAIRGILPLIAFIRKIQNSPDELTPIHCDLAKLCLAAKCLKPVVPFLDVDITSLLSSLDPFVDTERFLLYFYYGGMVYAAIKKWELALFYFEVVTTTPCHVLSRIMIEAYKKYILISLLVRGKYVPLPSYTSHLVNNNFKAMFKSYHDFANAYAKNDAPKVLESLNKNRETMIEDSNYGLAKQCIQSLTRRNILRLTKTFLTLSPADMADRVHLANANEAELRLLRMIEEKDIFATINQQDGMISFHDTPQDLGTSVSMLKDLEDNMAKCINLDERMQLMNHSLAVDKSFIRKTMRNHSGGLEETSFTDGHFN